MKTKSKMGMISPTQLMLVIFVSRVAVSLTNIQAVSLGKYSPDILISLAVSYVFVLLSSIPIVLCIKKERSPLDSKWIAFLYSLYFVIYASVTITRFAYFASTKMNPEISFEVFLIILSVAVCYGAYLGVESISRFGAFCAVLLILVMFVVIGLNINNMQMLNFFPTIVNSNKDIVSNAVLFSSNTIEPILVLALYNRVNGNQVKALYKGISLAFFSVFLLVGFSVGVLGNAADMQAFPIYSLFQMASSHVMSRLDIIHTSFWILGVFMKCSLLIYCASLFTKKWSNGGKCIAFSAASLVISFLVIKILGMSMVNPTKIVLIVLFVLFVIVVPVISLFVKRRKNNEKI